MLIVLPLLIGIVPLVAITIAHWLGAESGNIPGCFAYIEGCTSISATGRHPPGSFLFRAVELPFAALLAVLWFVVVAWLKALDDMTSKPLMRAILACGLIGAISLVVYTTFLGTREPLYEFMRRFGIYFYFAGTIFAQLMTSIELKRINKQQPAAGMRRVAHWMIALTVLPFALGLLNLALKAVLNDADTVENRIEWIVALMMQTWFVLLYFAWRKTGFRIRITADSTSVHR